jgi:type IV pilus assembly protein PilW
MSTFRIDHARGVTLIELMVALLIATVMIAGAVTVYSSSRSTYRTTEIAARLQETGRYALNMIEPDVRLAGFWGMMNGPDRVSNTVADASITSNCAAGWIGDASKAIAGIDAGAWTGLSGCPATNQGANTDVLIIKRADSKIAPVNAARVQIQSTRISATVFKGSAIPSGYAASSSETRDMVAKIYYISNSGTQFSLYRRTLAGSTMVNEEVIPGIQDLQVQFGVDTNNDGAADRYVNAGDVGTSRVASVKLWLLVVSEDAEIGYVDSTAYSYANVSYAAFNDNRRRILMTKTIQIRNSRT